MNPTLRNILIGCGALSVIGVFVIVGACSLILATGGGGEDVADSPVEEPGAEGQQAGEEQGSAEEQYFPLGETVTVGEVAWQVTNARQATELTSEFMEPRQGNFVVVDFTFTNNGSEAVTLDTVSLVLLDSENRKFEADPDTFGYIDPSKDIFLNQVNPGVTQEGEVIFTIAPGASNFVLQAGDTAFLEDESAYIELGF